MTSVDLGIDEPDTELTSGDGMVHFGQVEIDLLATHAGVAVPFPLQVPSFGRIPGERKVLLSSAGQTLAMRGLATDTGPVGAAAELVTALREYRGAIDLVIGSPEETVGVAALLYRSSALICRQRLDDDPTSTVGVRWVADSALADELFAMVPTVESARSMPIALPAAAVRSALRIVADPESQADLERRLRDVVREHGGDPAVLDQLTGLVSTVHGRGQLGATRHVNGQNVRTGAELSWLDGPRGRVRVSGEREGWMSVNSLSDKVFHAELIEMVRAARAPR